MTAKSEIGRHSPSRADFREQIDQPIDCLHIRGKFLDQKISYESLTSNGLATFAPFHDTPSAMKSLTRMSQAMEDARVSGIDIPPFRISSKSGDDSQCAFEHELQHVRKADELDVEMSQAGIYFFMFKIRGKYNPAMVLTFGNSDVTSQELVHIACAPTFLSRIDKQIARRNMRKLTRNKARRLKEQYKEKLGL